MQKQIRANDISGVWTALVTPFSRSRVDHGRMSELVSLAAEAKLTGIVPLGSTGESASLTENERESVISNTVKVADGKLRVMVGAGSNNTPKTIDNIKQAADLGADAVLVVAPYYNKPTPEGLKRHFLSVAESSSLPIVLYHIPSRCGVGIPLDLVIELAKHPRIIGIKEAGGDIHRSGEIARLTKGKFAVLSGDDPLTLPLMAVGAVGAISVISNLAPKKTRRMIDLCLSDDFNRARRIHRELSPLLNALSLETNPAPIKEAMNQTGMKVGSVRPPLAPVRRETRRAIRQAITDLGKIE